MRNVPEMTCLEFETVEFYGILFLIQLPIVGKFNTKHWIIVKFNYRFDSELLRNFYFVSTVGEFIRSSIIDSSLDCVMQFIVQRLWNQISDSSLD